MKKNLTTAQYWGICDIALVSKNNLAWWSFKHQSAFTLLTFAHVCIEGVVIYACCAVPRNIAVTALIDITSGCKNKSITISMGFWHSSLFYHIMRLFSRVWKYKNDATWNIFTTLPRTEQNIVNALYMKYQLNQSRFTQTKRILR